MMEQDEAGGSNPNNNTSIRAASAEKNRLLAAEKIKAAFKAAQITSTGTAPTGAAAPTPLAPLTQENVPPPPPQRGSTFSLSHERSANGASSLPPPPLGALQCNYDKQGDQIQADLFGGNLLRNASGMWLVLSRDRLQGTQGCSP